MGPAQGCESAGLERVRAQRARATGLWQDRTRCHPLLLCGRGSFGAAPCGERGGAPPRARGGLQAGAAGCGGAAAAAAPIWGKGPQPGGFIEAVAGLVRLVSRATAILVPWGGGQTHPLIRGRRPHPLLCGTPTVEDRGRRRGGPPFPSCSAVRALRSFLCYVCGKSAARPEAFRRPKGVRRKSLRCRRGGKRHKAGAAGWRRRRRGKAWSLRVYAGPRGGVRLARRRGNTRAARDACGMVD